MRRFNPLIILISLLFFACQKEDIPQEIAPPEMPTPSGPSWNLLQDADHLAKAYSSIVKLNLDHNDQLWIGSDYRGDDGVWRKGLWLFDGLAWDFIVVFEQHFPHASFIERIVFDEMNSLWFGHEQQLVGFDGTDFNQHDLPISFSNGKLQILKRETNGQIWMSIGHRLINHHGGEWSIDELPESVVDIHAFESFRTAQWISTNEGVFMIDENGTVKVEEVVTAEGDLITLGQVQDIIHWPGHGLVFASHFGLFHMKNEVWQKWDIHNSPLETDIIDALAIDHNQQLWLGNKDGLYHFDGTTFSYFKPPIIEHCIGCKPKALDIEIDSENRKWVLSDDNMIFIFEE